MPNLTLSPKLAQTLNMHSHIRSKMMAIPLDDIRERDIPLIEDLDNQIRSYLNNNKKLLDEWSKTKKYLLDATIYGYNSSRNTLIAAILAGAAIHRNDLNLRGDLSSVLINDKDLYVKQKKSLPHKISRLVNIYTNLTKKMKKDGKLDKAIKSLLGDNTKKLRVGTKLFNLDTDKIDAELANVYSQKLINIAGPPRLGSDQEERNSSAPSEIEFQFRNFECLKKQENPSDQIFWLNWIYELENLEEVYNQIDTAIKSGKIDELELKMQWKKFSWQSILYTEMTENKNQPVNLSLKSFRIYNGFCPWVSNFLCMEDDKQEYDAVKEVFDQVGDTAEIISGGASTVMAISGPTIVGAAAGAISSVAGLVSLTADLASGVVSIVNYFDEDDTLGSSDFTGKGDYLGQGVSGRMRNLPIPETKTAGNRNRGAAYDITCIPFLKGPMKSFNRSWRYNVLTTKTKKIHRTHTLCCGGSGDDKIKLEFEEAVNKLVLVPDIKYQREGNNRHAEWKIRPTKLEPGNKTIKGVVHWGVRACSDIDYYPSATGMKFINHL